MDRKGDTLSLFHPLIGQWFAERLGAPTEIQERAWPVIAAGKHALVTAPTGSGKTLTAFLWAINQLITGAWGGGLTRTAEKVTRLINKGDLRIPDYLAFCKVILTRQFSPGKAVLVETINGKPARESEYAKPMTAFGFSRYHKGLELVRKY